MVRIVPDQIGGEAVDPRRTPGGSAAKIAKLRELLRKRIDLSSSTRKKFQNGDRLGPRNPWGAFGAAIFLHNTPRPGRVKDDPHGTNLPDVAAALSHAERLRRESPYNDPALVMIVKDEARKMVLSLPFFPGC
jgi:hypothetical protein